MEDYIPTSPNIDNDTTSLSSIAVGDVSEQNADIKKPRSLLDLPPEIWSRICKLAAIQYGTIELFGGRDPPHFQRKVFGYGDKKVFQQRVYQPAITRVCTTIRDETIASFYSLNTFVIQDDEDWSDMSTFKAWTRAIGAAHKRNLKQLYVRTEHVARSQETPHAQFQEMRAHIARCPSRDWLWKARGHQFPPDFCD